MSDTLLYFEGRWALLIKVGCGRVPSTVQNSLFHEFDQNAKCSKYFETFPETKRESVLTSIPVPLTTHCLNGLYFQQNKSDEVRRKVASQE